jgi:hypothetical protein
LTRISRSFSEREGVHLVSKDASPKRANRIYPRKRKALVTSPEPSVRIKRLTLDLPEPLHRAIKKNAAEEGVTMAQRLRAILAEKYHFTGKHLRTMRLERNLRAIGMSGERSLRR